jgi:DNA-directed RNA polymerase specialized sigma24 family protein
VNGVANKAWTELINAIERTTVRDPRALLLTIGKRRARDWHRDRQRERGELQRYCEAEQDNELEELADKLALSAAIKQMGFADEPISNANLRVAVHELP